VQISASPRATDDGMQVERDADDRAAGWKLCVGPRPGALGVRGYELKECAPG
jgi:hypothetical protein